MLFSSKELIRNFSTLNRSIAAKTKKNLIQNRLNFRKKPISVTMFIPFTLKISVAKNRSSMLYNVFLYNSYIKFNFYLPLNYLTVKLNKETNVITLVSLAYSNFVKRYISLVIDTLNAFFKINFRKLKFKGKGYYIYKNQRNTIAPQFGYSHRLYIYSWFNSLKFSSKTTLLLFGFVSTHLQKAAIKLKTFRDINVFTGRGVRFSRQRIYSKPGKISTYR